MTTPDAASTRSRCTIFALWSFIGFAILARVYVIVGSDCLALWNVTTATGFVEWPTIAFGIVQSDWKIALAVLLIITWTAAAAKPEAGLAPLLVIVVGFFAVVILVEPWVGLLYGILAGMTLYSAPKFMSEKIGWKKDLVGWLLIGVIFFYAGALQDSDKGWAPIEVCNLIDGGEVESVRVLPMKVDGTSTVSFELDNHQVVRANDCRLADNNSILE